MRDFLHHTRIAPVPSRKMDVSLPCCDGGSGGRGRGRGASRAGARGAAAGCCARRICSRGCSSRPNLPTAHPIPLRTWSTTTMQLPPLRKRLAPTLLSGGMTSRPSRTRCSALPRRPIEARTPTRSRRNAHPDTSHPTKNHRTMPPPKDDDGILCMARLSQYRRSGPCVRSYPKIGHPTKNHQTTPPPRDNNGQ